MAELVESRYHPTIVWLGVVRDRAQSLAAHPVQTVEARFGGLVGDAHFGVTRAACSRVRDVYPRDTPIKNTRQFSILSEEEITAISVKMGIDALDPAWLGASMVVRGLPDLSHLPPSSRLQGPDGATLVVDTQNRPCQLPAKVIAQFHPDVAASFRTAASARRGVTAWVEREGAFGIGQSLRLFVPDQRSWQPETLL